MLNLTCATCGARLKIAEGSGRPAIYCSNACRQRAHRLRAIPGQMLAQRRWVRWTLTSTGRKLPVQVGSNRAASVADPSTWGSHRAATTAPRMAGIGYVLGDGIGCVDLDDCIDADGELSPLARTVLDLNPGAWTERSVSGRGLHVFGALPEAPGRRTRGLEVYSRGRFIGLTQDVYRGGGLPALALP